MTGSYRGGGLHRIALSRRALHGYVLDVGRPTRGFFFVIGTALREGEGHTIYFLPGRAFSERFVLGRRAGVALGVVSQ